MRISRENDSKEEEQVVEKELAVEEVKQPTREDMIAYYKEEMELLELREKFSRLNWMIIQHEVNKKKAIIEFANVSSSMMEQKETK